MVWTINIDMEGKEIMEPLFALKNRTGMSFQEARVITYHELGIPCGEEEAP